MNDSSCRDNSSNNNKTTKESNVRQNCNGSYQNAVKFVHNDKFKATAERRECTDQSLSHIDGSNRTNDESNKKTSVYNRVNSRYSSAAMRWDVSNPLSSQLQGIEASSDRKTLKLTSNFSIIFATNTMNDELSTTATNIFECDSRTTVQDIMHVHDEVAASSHCIERSVTHLCVEKSDSMILDGSFDKIIIHHEDEETCVISWDDSYKQYMSRKQDILLEKDRIWNFYLQKRITIREWYDLQASLTNEINEMLRILCDIALIY